ncbi:MAG: hypothetical protein M1814_002403 [Vezdaea aestivalis]|nr:MAG: hypothetical protein M1814_002403 [Vezdaea aestivalis]
MASGSLVLPSHNPSNPSNPSTLTNGHMSPLADNVINAEDIHSSSASDSDLSEIIEPPNLDATPSPLESGTPNSRLAGFGIQDDAHSNSDGAVSSDDADFEVETPPLPRASLLMSERSSSLSSQRPSKRKMSIDDESYIKNNPELYGLRRSGRARLHRPMVESSDEDEENEYNSDIVSSLARKRRKQVSSTRGSKQPTPASNSPSDSGSDSDLYQQRRHRILHKKRAKQQVSGNLVPSHAEIRFSTRQAGKVNNYNEDDDSPPFSEDEDMMTPNDSALGAGQEVIESIDTVLDYRPKEEVDITSDNISKDDFEYYIKWTGRAHYHATWETSASLANYGGLRKLHNYYLKTVLVDCDNVTSTVRSPEERERDILDRETKMEAINEHMLVERVIATQEGEEETEYLVKWKGLFYDSCTWEQASLVSQISQNEIDKFLDRSANQLVSTKSESAPMTRSQDVSFREQPEYIKHGTLRDFQVKGCYFLAHSWAKNKNVILADEMGLGKTVQTVAFLNWLRHDRNQQGPFLVVVPLSTVPSWADTFDHWTPDINYIIYNGGDKARNVIKEHELFVDSYSKRTKFHVLITTYEYCLLDASFLSQIKWQYLAVDEAHRLKNRNSQLYSILLSFKASNRLLITGTPMQNTLEELSALMDFLDPGVVDVDENMDLTSEAASHKIAQLTAQIRPYMYRRTKNTVENDLPPKSEKIIRVELADIQLEYYRNIFERNWEELNRDTKGQKQSLLNIMMELKKASNHPFLITGAEDRILAGSDRREDLLKGLITSSGKMMLLDQLLRKLRKDNHRVLIFSQMVKMLDLLGDYLHLRGYQFQRLDGTIAAGPRRLAIDHFNAPDSDDFCFLLSTRAGGLGINLMTADTVILFDSDWNPQADLQAMARAHRIGQQKPVTVYRLVARETIEEEILERARNKLMLEFITIQRGVTDQDARDLTNRLKMAGKKVDEPTSSTDISRILKSRAKRMFEQSGNQKKLEDLDIDAVLETAEVHQTEDAQAIEADGGEEFLRSFEYTDVKLDTNWDDIIPKERLEVIKAETEKKKNEEFLQDVITQNQPRKRKAANEQRNERAAKKQARDAARLHFEPSEPEEELDPARPLNEKEIRNLIRGFLRYGDLEDRGDDVVKDANLEGRDRSVLKQTLDEITIISTDKMREENERMQALETTGNKAVTRKDRKAVLFDYHGVKRLNAETILERPGEMRMLKEVVEMFPDFKKFRIAEASKAAHYTAIWGAREDGMLCVGISRYGYGAWVQIRNDPELAMQDKFYLEEHRVEKKEERVKGDEKNARSPGAVHLVRRADYLLSVLKDKTSNGTNAAAKRALENHHRNNKKGSMASIPRRGDKASASPAPSAGRKGVRESDKHRMRPAGGSDRRGSTERSLSTGEGAKSRPNHGRTHSRGHEDRHNHHRPIDRNQRSTTDHRPSKPSEHRRSDANGSMDNDALLRQLFDSVLPNLELLRSGCKAAPDRAAALKEHMLKVGRHIQSLSAQADAKTGEMLWDFVKDFWPSAKPKPVEDIKKMYKRVLDGDDEAKKAAQK